MDEDFTLKQLNRDRGRDIRTRNKQQREIKRVVGKVRKIFSDEGENFDDGDEKMLVGESAIKPDFPYIIVTAAIIKDLLDIPLDVSVVGIILTTILSFILFLVLFMWVLGKLGGGWWKKKIIRWLWIRYIAAIILEFVPFFQIVPATTIFILMAHYKEKKIVRLFNLALEELRHAGVLKYIK